MPGPLRFVVQRHETPAGAHWDLMLEQADALATWRMDRPAEEVIGRSGPQGEAAVRPEDPPATPAAGEAGSSPVAPAHPQQSGDGIPSQEPGPAMRLVRIFDHPKRFLDYEGPLRSHPGSVRIHDRGTYETIRRSDEEWVVRIEGQRWRGVYRLAPRPALGEGVWEMRRG